MTEREAQIKKAAVEFVAAAKEKAGVERERRALNVRIDQIEAIARKAADFLRSTVGSNLPLRVIGADGSDVVIVRYMSEALTSVSVEQVE